MIMTSHIQHEILMNLCEDKYPEIFLKIVGTENDIDEFHHDLWGMPFYQKLVEKSKGINTTKFLYLSDRQVNSSSLFYIYEISFSILSLKGTYNIEKRKIDVHEDKQNFTDSLSMIIGKSMAERVPPEIWNYTIIL